MPSSGRAPGADDNGSATVGVMVAAEILSKYKFERTIRFALFTGEEQGLHGSKAYANKVGGENIVAVYSMDMIAWDNVGGPVLRLHTRTKSNPGYSGDKAIADTFVDVVNDFGKFGSITMEMAILKTRGGELFSGSGSFNVTGTFSVLPHQCPA